MSAERSWRLAAQGLLRPSPLRSPDGELQPDPRERERWERIDRILGPLQGDEELLYRCMRDAYDAHVPAQAGSAGLRVERVHPLSAQRLHVIGESEWSAWFDEEIKLLEEVERDLGGRDVDEDQYLRLWRRVIPQYSDARNIRDRVPGSLAATDHGVSAHRGLTAALMAARHRGGQAALLYLHLGPVQGFIKAARRTHDLWVASYTLSYLLLNAAVAIAKQHGPHALVYPYLAALPAAAPLLFNDARQADRDELRRRLHSSLSNTILAVVPLEKAHDVANVALAKAKSRWKELASAARSTLQEAGQRDFWDGPEGQLEKLVEDHLELDAVVQPWPDKVPELRSLLGHFDMESKHLEKVPEERTGYGYGDLYNLSHRVLGAHRSASLPRPARGDQRPKCIQCGRREQTSPFADKPSRQKHESRKFFTELSRGLQERSRSGDREGGGRLSLHLRLGEGLCAVCLTKRLATECFYGDKGRAGLGLSWADTEHRTLLRFPSVPTIASAPFRYRLLRPDPERLRPGASYGDALGKWLHELRKLHGRDCLDFTPPGNLLPGMPAGAAPQELLEHEGQWLYESNYEAETAWRNYYPDERSAADPDWIESLQRRLENARAAYRTVRDLAGIGPSSYYAVLVLDGDNMGKWLTGQHRNSPRLSEVMRFPEKQRANMRRPLFPALHSELAQRLARLAETLHDIVEGYLGRVVYSGGDDLLAFLPLQTALPCMRAVEGAFRSPSYLGDRVTVSAGLAVAHIRTPLSRALHNAREAEKLAKSRGRARFAIHVDKRSGADLDICLPWRMDHHSRTVDSIEALSTLIARSRDRSAQRDDDEALLRVDMAYRLEQELPAIEHMPEAFATRVRTLMDKSLPDEASSALQAVLGHYMEKGRTGPREMVDLLLFLRFLLREEHGIDTQLLIEELKREVAS